MGNASMVPSSTVSVETATRTSEKIISSIAFYPPPPTYSHTHFSLRRSTHQLWKDSFRNSLTFNGVKSPHLLIQYKNALKYSPGIPDSPPRATIIFSHGNAEDIGQTFLWLVSLSLSLQVDIISYEYPGFGLFEGELSLRGIIDSIFEAFIAYKLDPRKTILYGRSIGSIPTTRLASSKYRQKFFEKYSSKLESVSEDHWNPNQRLSGSVMAPFLGVFLQTPICAIAATKIKNDLLIGSCLTQHLIILGAGKDKVLENHSKLLFETFCKEKSLPFTRAVISEIKQVDCRESSAMKVDHILVENAGHNDLETTYPDFLFAAFRRFSLHFQDIPSPPLDFACTSFE